MSATVFTGPVLAGNVLNSDGSGNLAGAGGDSGTQNVGFCEMMQVASITQSSTAAATTIVIPAQSFIVSIDLFVSTGWAATTTLGIGTSSSANELATGLTAANLVQGKYTVPVTTLVAAWTNTSSTQDVKIWVKSSSGTAGVAQLVVRYAQGINGYTSGQYT
jgi:hypothetical protein